LTPDYTSPNRHRLGLLRRAYTGVKVKLYVYAVIIDSVVRFLCVLAYERKLGTSNELTLQIDQRINQIRKIQRDYLHASTPDKPRPMTAERRQTNVSIKQYNRLDHKPIYE